MSAIRPSRFAEFFGQADVVAQLKVAVASAQAQNKPLGHVLLVGPAGGGKTTLGSEVVPGELGVVAQSLNCAAVESVKDLFPVISEMPARGVLFLDEIHALIPEGREQLLTVLEDQSITVTTPAGSIMTIKVRPFTVIAATTRFGVLDAPLRSRFRHVLRLQLYTDAEMAQVLAWTARKRNAGFGAGAVEALIPVVHGVARNAVNLVESCLDTIYARGLESEPMIHAEVVRTTLDRLGYRGDLAPMEYRYLAVLAERRGGRAGLSTMAALLDETVKTVEDVYEPWLLHRGLISRDADGRRVTDQGLAYLKGV